MSRLDHRLEPDGEVRRFEVITGVIGRRRWSADDRARILEETLTPGAVVSEVARRHGLTPQQLFTWRREARKAAETLPVFVPAVVERTGSEAFEEEQTDGSPQTYSEQTIILRQMVRPITTTFLCSDQVATTTPDSSAPITRPPSAVIIDFANARRRVAVG